jgi:hypothetical protein
MFGGPAGVWRHTGAEAEGEATAADRLHRRCARGHERGVAIGDVHHERAKPDRRRGFGQRAAEREALQHRVVPAEHGTVEMIEHPRRHVTRRLGCEHPVAQHRPGIGRRVQLDVDLHTASLAPEQTAGSADRDVVAA